MRELNINVVHIGGKIMNNKSEALAMKIDEMTERLEALLADSNISDNTKKTQKFQRTKEIRTLVMMKALIDGTEFSKEMEEWFMSLTTLTSERKKSQVEVHVGDNVMQLCFTKYKDVTNIVAKINKAVEKAGLRIVDGIVTE